MNTYKVKYEFRYPGAVNDFRTAYVLATDFQDAQVKVEKKYVGEYEKAHVVLIELLESDIIV